MPAGDTTAARISVIASGLRKLIVMTDSLQVRKSTIDPYASPLGNDGMRPFSGPVRSHQSRSAISRLVLEIARAGLSPFGQVLVQFMMVWQR